MREVDTLKNGSTNFNQRDLSSSAYALPVNECRRLLQSICNILYSDSDKQPDIKKLPKLVTALRDYHNKHTQLTLSMGDPSQFTTKAVSDIDMFTGFQHLIKPGSSKIFAVKSPRNRKGIEDPINNYGQRIDPNSTPWSAKGNNLLDLNFSKKASEQCVVSERPLEIRQESSSTKQVKSSKSAARASKSRKLDNPDADYLTFEKNTG